VKERFLPPVALSNLTRSCMNIHELVGARWADRLIARLRLLPLATTDAIGCCQRGCAARVDYVVVGRAWFC